MNWKYPERGEQYKDNPYIARELHRFWLRNFPKTTTCLCRKSSEHTVLINIYLSHDDVRIFSGTRHHEGDYGEWTGAG